MLKVTKYLALYPQCGGRGQQGINHAEAWTNQFNDYLYSANYFLNQLYSNVNVRNISFLVTIIHFIIFFMFCILVLFGNG